MRKVILNLDFVDFGKACYDYLNGELITQNDRRRIERLKAVVDERAFRRFAIHYGEKKAMAAIARDEGVAQSSVSRSISGVEYTIYKDKI